VMCSLSAHFLEEAVDLEVWNIASNVILEN
jgi:hypothetical protein